MHNSYYKLGIREKGKILIASCCLTILHFIAFSCPSYSQSLKNQTNQNKVIIRKIENNHIIYDTYFLNVKSPKAIDISDLIIWDKISKQENSKKEVFNSYYDEGINYRIFLLEKGYAKLKKLELAQSEEIKAQNKAKDNYLGIWEREPNLLESFWGSINFSFILGIFAGVALIIGLLYILAVTSAERDNTREREAKARQREREQEVETKLKEAEKREQEAKAKLSEAEDKIIRMKNSAEEIDRTEYIYQDIVLLGPRNSGKTSIVKLWRTPWHNIHHNTATQSWETYEFDMFPVKEDKKFDQEFEVAITVNTILRLRLHDYPGDDTYREQAIEKLGNLQNAVILFVFDLDVKEGKIPSNYNVNNSYYSRMFVEAMNNSKKLTSSVKRAFVVFNKIDYLRDDWHEEFIIDKLKEVNNIAVNNIEGFFSPRIDYYAVSAENNKWLLSLLGNVHKVAMENYNVDAKIFESYMNKLSQELK
jgi:GTPase SAR1 family protein